MGLSVTNEGPLRALALSVYILAMVLAFGAILLVDWHGFLWLIGAFLSPDLSNPLDGSETWAVLVLMVNGISIVPAVRPARVSPPSSTSVGLRSDWELDAVPLPADD